MKAFYALFGFFLIVGLGFWFTRPKLSDQEKGFVSYVQSEARKRNLKKIDLEGYLSINFNTLIYIHSEQIGGGLVLNNVPRIKRAISDSY